MFGLKETIGMMPMQKYMNRFHSRDTTHSSSPLFPSPFGSHFLFSLAASADFGEANVQTMCP